MATYAPTASTAWVPTASTASALTVWITWTATTTVSYTDPWPSWVQGTTYTSGQVASVTPAAEMQERFRVQAEARGVEYEAARQRARTLLLSMLDRKQKQEFERDGHFHVHTKDGVRTYRLRPGSPPVRVKGEDGRRWAYCIHPTGIWPPDDIAITHKLLLEHDEEEFLRIANASAA